MSKVDSETVFTGAAALLTIVALIHYILHVEMAGYSPVTKYATIFLFLSGVFVLTQQPSESRVNGGEEIDRSSDVRIFGYVVIVTTLVVVCVRLITIFQLGASATVWVLLLLAGTLFMLRNSFDAEYRFISASAAKTVFDVTAVVVFVVILVDLGTGGVAYELTPETEIEYTDSPHDRGTIATLSVHNPSPLPERVDPPQYHACTAGNWSEYQPTSNTTDHPRNLRLQVVTPDTDNEYVISFGTKTYAIETHLVGATNVEGETFPVTQTTQCPPDETGDPYIALFPQSESSRPSPVTLGASDNER